jgi:hypothetical protein
LTRRDLSRYRHNVVNERIELIVTLSPQTKTDDLMVAAQIIYMAVKNPSCAFNPGNIEKSLA